MAKLVGFINRHLDTFPAPVVAVFAQGDEFHGVYPSGHVIRMNGSINSADKPAKLEDIIYRPSFINFGVVDGRVSENAREIEITDPDTQMDFTAVAISSKLQILGTFQDVIRDAGNVPLSDSGAKAELAVYIQSLRDLVDGKDAIRNDVVNKPVLQAPGR